MSKTKLFIAPHNDDEALFGSYIILREKPKVVVVTRSFLQEKRGIYWQTREQESREAMKILGAEIEFLNLPDVTLNEKELIECLKKYSNIEKVYAPGLQNGNREHDIVSKACTKVFKDKVIYYATYTKENFTPVGSIEIKPTLQEIKLKNKALECYKSQAHNYKHFDAVRGKLEYLR